ncbi:TEX36 protein, partial [Cisticola juncidis]|nr:TEX36 protein [Cisticola juncidis]
FAHEGEQEGELESTTSASLRHVLDTAAALGTEFRQPLEYKARVEKAGNNHFPFSSHDNRHEICNAVEYFDLVST